jgi:RNA polymerase sigma-70 factor (ECF subfamily)
VTQKTFIAAFTRLEEFTAGTNFAAWLFSIARFQLMTEQTRLRRLADYHSRFAADLVDRELERRTELPAAEGDERLAHLRACLDELGDNVRRFIRWRYTDEIPLLEMAERTGRSLPAMKKQLWLLRQKLQDCIQQKMATEARGAA